MARGEGLRVRLSKIPGETPKGVLDTALILPAVIDAFGWTEEAGHTEYDTVRAGQFSQPQLGPPTARRLRMLDDVGTLTVDWDPPWLVEQGQDPDDVHDTMYGILRSRRPCELLATPKFGPTRPLLRVNITIRGISAVMKRGEPDSMYYTLKIVEWRNASAARRGAGVGGDVSRLPTTHRLTATDTLYSLSMLYYHTASGATAIARANGIKSWGKKTPLVGLARFRVGSKITIPKVAISENTVGPSRIGGV